jgi:regulator of protease activity HflC (stomatin/prohibitin superfamily)
MAIIQANGYANATITKANADAEAVRIISEQMNVSPQYATYLYYQTWDGKLPYIYGSDVPLIFNLPSSNSTSP